MHEVHKGVMASKPKKSTARKSRRAQKAGRPGFAAVRWIAELHPVRRIFHWLRRLAVFLVLLLLLWIAAYAVFDPPTTPYILSEKARLGEIDQEWVPLGEVAPVLRRSVVAAEDANFCTHWGFDMGAIRAAISDGGNRGASTITQQMVKNAFLWQGRSWPRKALEAMITPVVELLWTKRRILEVYLNVAEFDEGVFGIEAAARHYFGSGPDALSSSQAALLAAILPNPKLRSASRPTLEIATRARRIQDGAATIRKDGRSACFED